MRNNKDFPATKTIIDIFYDDNNDDISLFERHGNIAVKCELSCTSDVQINLVGKHVRSKKHERFIFKELHATTHMCKESTVMQVRLPNLNVTIASNRILRCKSRLNTNA